MKHFIRREEGQGMVEFALAVPIVFFLLLSIMQFGIYFGKRLDIQSSTREAARQVSLNYGSKNANQIASQKLASSLSLTDPSKVSVAVTPSPLGGHGDPFTVTVQTPWEISVMGKTFYKGNIRSQAEGKLE